MFTEPQVALDLTMQDFNKILNKANKNAMRQVVNLTSRTFEAFPAIEVAALEVANSAVQLVRAEILFGLAEMCGFNVDDMRNEIEELSKNA